MVHKFDFMDDQEWFAEKKEWYNGKTFRLTISDSFRRSPFAQGYNDCRDSQGNPDFYNNPFSGDKEVEWMLQYHEGWEYGERMIAEQEKQYNSLWG